MDVLLTLTTAGLDTGPFDIYTNVDNFVAPIETGITKYQLVTGYLCTAVPDGTTIIRVKSTGDCTNYADASIGFTTPTPTPTHTPTPTPTVTPTPTPTNTPQASGGPPYNHAGSISSETSGNLACNLSCYGKEYWSTTATLSVGVTVYDNVNLTPFNGQNLWWKITVNPVGYPGNVCKAFKINGSGVILEIYNC